MRTLICAEEAAREVFGRAELGDRRRTKALVELTAEFMRRPAGRLSQIFRGAAARERAYRFVENAAVQLTAVLSAMTRAAASRVALRRLVYVAVDGSSLTLADPMGRKDFGRIGSGRSRSRGLKVITALPIEMSGAPLGIPLAQRYWARKSRLVHGSKGSDRRRRAVHDKETQHWLDVIDAAAAHVDHEKLWYIIDREGDSRNFLVALSKLGSRFTIRSSWNRLLALSRSGKRTYLREAMASAPVIGQYEVDVTAGPKRTARSARMELRSARVPLLLKDRWLKVTSVLEVNVVWAREVEPHPSGEKPLDWMLLTNAVVETCGDALAVVRSYQMRWRIEDFHKTWKSSHCNVEATQLHTMHAATIFAAMHATVAARAERLKHLARTTPDEPASIELDRFERKAVAVCAYQLANAPVVSGGRRQHHMVVPDPETMTIGVAVHWIALQGGYSKTPSRGPPGAIVIGRGLEDVVATARTIQALAGLQK